MLRHLVVGLPTMALCLILQALFVASCLRRYVRYKESHREQFERQAQLADVVLLAMVMTLMLLGNFVQMAICGSLFMLLGEFHDPELAMYHSGVNFAGLGYGDIVMSTRWRLLGPIEAANGILKFGLSTALMSAAVMDILKNSRARILHKEYPPTE